MRLLWACLCLSLFFPAQSAEYAIIVAGSNGYWNYRHQADACHAYHVLIDHGFDPDNVILMSYDDVPTSLGNVFPNTLFNRPGNNSVDVNVGCVKDYTGEDVNTKNFLAIIAGNATGVSGGNGKVLTSGPNDNVFINFIDHGATGLVAFPSTYLYADQLNEALSYMYSHQMYKKLVFYLEACGSGSMFENLLPNNTFVFATTAADPSESSWATYCTPDNYINKTFMAVCLGDLYSVSWMENSDSLGDLTVETLQGQFEKVRTRTNLSHVMQYGDFTYNNDSLSQFQGEETAVAQPVFGTSSSNWNSYDVKLKYLYSLYMRDPTEENQQALSYEIAVEGRTKENFQELANILDPSGKYQLLEATATVFNFECLRKSVEDYETMCGQLGDYGLQFVQVLVNVCEMGNGLWDLNLALNEVCWWYGNQITKGTADA